MPVKRKVSKKSSKNGSKKPARRHSKKMKGGDVLAPTVASQARDKEIQSSFTNILQNAKQAIACKIDPSKPECAKKVDFKLYGGKKKSSKRSHKK